MDLGPAGEWTPPEHWMRVTTIESHAGGEPFRVVIDGLPELPGDTVLERRRHAIENYDHLRKALMWEPRGHADMYGGWLGPPVERDSDLSVLFLHNEGFSTMCGHGIIALAKVLVDTGTLGNGDGETTLRVDTPAGQIIATATTGPGGVSSVRFRNVPSFATSLDGKVTVPGYGQVRYDLGFGGAFYAYVEASSLGLDMSDAPSLIAAGKAIKASIIEGEDITHPVDPDLGFLYGVIFTGPPNDVVNHSRHVCVFADGEVDRSPTGTGVSGRLAILHARGVIAPGESLTVESIVGSEFTGHIVDMTRVGDVPAVVPEIAGTAHIIGRSEYWIDPDDTLNPGFFIR